MDAACAISSYLQCSCWHFCRQLRAAPGISAAIEPRLQQAPFPARSPQRFDASCEASPYLPPDNAVQGETNEGELWALPPGPWEPQVDEDFRITVHVTGAGDLAIDAVGPDGSEHRPSIGPVRQFGAGSGLERPGDEWSMVFRFDQPGCWQIDVTRGELEGSIGFEVLR
ncbi:MAG: hypothetical protein KY393_04190 [Actinobacteria bacterium]|nr:hypothetical protein [Actinomycetota bacterium]